MNAQAAAENMLRLIVATQHGDLPAGVSLVVDNEGEFSKPSRLFRVSRVGKGAARITFSEHACARPDLMDLLDDALREAQGLILRSMACEERSIRHARQALAMQIATHIGAGNAGPAMALEDFMGWLMNATVEEGAIV